MRSLSKSRKAQFFILSAFAIISILFVISQWVEPFKIIDTSSAILDDEIFVFNNLKEQSILAVKNSKDCNDLKFNIEEFKLFVDNYILQKNMRLTFNYVITSPCVDSQLATEIYIAVSSTKTSMDSKFTATK